MRRVWIWGGAIALLALAWVVALVTPEEDAGMAPFVVPMQIGEQATGRDLAITVRDVVVSDGVETRRWIAEGTWLVVDLDAALVDGRETYGLGHAVLLVGDTTISASERPTSIRTEPLSAGVPRSGSLAFELPADALDQSVVLQLATDSDTRLDSVLELPLDLAQVPREADVELEETTWTHP